MVNEIVLYEIPKLLPSDKYGLMSGKCGILIYLSERIGEGKSEKEFASIFNEVLSDMQKSTDYSMCDGILGVAICYLYLSRQNGIEGNVDFLLKELDMKLFKDFKPKGIFKDEQELEKAIETLLYLSIRIRYKFKNISEKDIYTNLTTELFEKTYRTICNVGISFFHDEPMPFSLLNYNMLFLICLANLAYVDLYKVRIKHLLEELCITITSHLPYLEANRLLKMAVLYYVNRVVGLNDRYLEHLRILQCNTSLDFIFDKELNGRELLFMDGICGIYLLAILINKFSSLKIYNITRTDILNRIDRSPYWERRNNSIDGMPIGLNGIYGLKMFIEYVEDEKI